LAEPFDTGSHSGIKITAAGRLVADELTQHSRR
jgi:hypothetical protein